MRPVRTKLEELVHELGPDHVFSTTRRAVRADRYGVVLVLLVALFVLLSTAADDWGRLPAAALSLGVVLVILRTSGLTRALRLVGWFAAVSLLSMALLSLVVDGSTPGAVSDAMQSIVFAFTALVIAIRIGIRGRVSGQTVFAAIDVYLLIGFAFAFLYSSVQGFESVSFFADRAPGDRNEFLYFSFVTISTLGYGDFTPATALGRSLAVLETLTGQLFLVTAVARLVSMVGQDLPARRRRNEEPEPG